MSSWKRLPKGSLPDSVSQQLESSIEETRSIVLPNKNQGLRVMGVDPGTLKFGVGVVQLIPEEKTLYAKTVLLKGSTLAKRLRHQFEVLDALMKNYQPHVVVCEKSFFAKNVQSALLLGHSRGVILLASEIHGTHLVEYSATEVKKSVVGTGHGSKSQVQDMVARLLKLSRAVSEDASDALALALCYSRNHFNHLRRD